MDIQWVDSQSNDIIVSDENPDGTYWNIRLKSKKEKRVDGHILTNVSELTTPQMGEVVMFLCECGCEIFEHPDNQFIAWQFDGYLGI